MDRDARKMRGERPFLFANMRAGDGIADIVDFIVCAGGLEKSARPLDAPA